MTSPPELKALLCDNNPRMKVPRKKMMAVFKGVVYWPDGLIDRLRLTLEASWYL